MTPDHPQRDYRDLNVLVMGLGSFGGGAGVVRFLADRGANVTATTGAGFHCQNKFISLVSGTWAV